jgi:hypothetical protein
VTGLHDHLGPTDYVTLRFSLVDEVGFDAAVLIERIRWRCARRPAGWVATYAELGEETRLSHRRVKAAVNVLRERGWLRSENAGIGARTLRWTVVLEQAEPDVTKRPERPVRKATKGPERPDQEAGAARSSSYRDNSGIQLHTAHAVEEEPVIDDQPLEGVLFAVPASVPTGPPQTAQTLVARWVDGYRTSNAGQDPPGPLMKRVAGQAKNLAKVCENDADWGAAWRASYSAGQSGHADAVPFMAAARSRYPQQRNHDLDYLLAQNGTAGPVQLNPTTEQAMKMFSGETA